MTALICGSMAFDTVMVFNGRFRDHILPDRIHLLNVSFLVPSLRRNFGGCAGNIAYAMRQLGGTPLPVATLGNDGGDDLARLRQLSAHEVGHSIGLAHNFAASTQDRASVMDYQPFNLAAPGEKQGEYVQSTLGAYDYLAPEEFAVAFFICPDKSAAGNPDCDVA